MLTFSSREVTTDSGTPSILDIGIHLGRIPRWAGATKKFYPVLLHVMTVADLLPLKYQIHGLLHDSDEAITEDVPGPIKPEELHRTQQKIRLRIYKETGIAPPSDEVEALVKRADGIAVPALGPYPRRGEYEHCFTLEGPGGEFIPLTSATCEAIVLAVQWSRNQPSSEKRAALAKREERSERDWESNADAVLDDATPAFHGQPFVASAP